MKLKIAFFIFIFLCLVFASNANAQTNNQSNSSGDKKQDEKPLKITDQPKVEFRREDCQLTKGVITLKITFDKSGKVTKAKVIKSSGCENTDKQALESAWKIKFTPAMKNGEPQTVVKQVKYTFEIY